MSPEEILDELASKAYEAIYTDDFWAEYASGCAVTRANSDGTVDHIRRADFFTDTRDPSHTGDYDLPPALQKEDRS